MEFYDQSWTFTNFPPELYQICIFFVTIKKLSRDLESLHFPRFSAKHRECKNGEERKSRNCHGKIMEKYLFKSVGTLSDTR